jgi:DNA-binding transcriptional LysR family regulator
MIDLNLLIIFDAVMAEGSVKKAALRLGMKAPAVSQSLTRLKDTIGAELFIRARDGLKPTPRATAMWDGVRTGLASITTSVSGDATFDPSTQERTIVLDLPSGSDALITPKLAARTALAPGLQFRISSSRAFNVLNDLRFGESWLALDYRQITEPAYRCELLTEQEFVLIARTGHPALDDGLTVDAFEQLPQVAVAAVRTTSVLPVTERLEAIGMTRRVKFTVPGLLSAVQMVAALDVVATLPLCTARLCAAWGDVEIHRLPFELAKAQFYMVWHQRFDGDPGHSWLRQTMREICAEF